jgi:hypothetical protein
MPFWYTCVVLKHHTQMHFYQNYKKNGCVLLLIGNCMDLGICTLYNRGNTFSDQTKWDAT